MNQTFTDLMQLFIPLVVIVTGLVEFLKSALNLSGRLVTLVSFVVGALVGGAVFAAYQFPTLQPWVSGSMFVLAAGLTASGFYKIGVTLMRR